MMMNYQVASVDGGGGYFRIMQVNDAEGVIHMITYSPHRDDYNLLDNGETTDERYILDTSLEEFTAVIPWR